LNILAKHFPFTLGMENFYSEKGVAYVKVKDKVIRTAYKSEEFDSKVKE